jgi:outer membrane scaffolding protein for murein synthesis (MipA/OmpV family)
MGFMKKITPLLLMFVLASVAVPAYAEGSAMGGNIMLGGGMAPEYEGSKDYKFIPMLMGKLEYDNYYLEVKGPGLRANLSPWDGLEFGPVVSLRGGRDSDVDNKYVAKMRRIDDATEAGVFAKISSRNLFSNKDELSLEAEYSADTGDTHEGYTVSIESEYAFFPVKKLRLGISLSATYADENYNMTYFGVDADNAARSGLKEYSADGGLKNVGVGLKAGYSFNMNWGIMGIVKYEQLMGDAADSPIVDKDGSEGQFMTGAGIMYRF